MDLPMAMRFRHLKLYAREAVGVFRLVNCLFSIQGDGDLWSYINAKYILAITEQNVRRTSSPSPDIFNYCWTSDRKKL